jgi:hypothetical protein
MPSKKPAAAKRRKSKPTSLAGSSLAAVIAQNLANMATVLASSGSILLVLLIAKRF